MRSFLKMGQLTTAELQIPYSTSVLNIHHVTRSKSASQHNGRLLFNEAAGFGRIRISVGVGIDMKLSDNQGLIYITVITLMNFVPRD